MNSEPTIRLTTRPDDSGAIRAALNTNKVGIEPALMKYAARLIYPPPDESEAACDARRAEVIGVVKERNALMRELISADRYLAAALDRLTAELRRQGISINTNIVGLDPNSDPNTEGTS